MKNWKKITALFLLVFILSITYHSVENFSKLSKNWMPGKSKCRDRKTCSSCLNNGYDSTGGLCYWCKSGGCINPSDDNDAKYYNSSCSTNKKCLK